MGRSSKPAGASGSNASKPQDNNTTTKGQNGRKGTSTHNTLPKTLPQPAPAEFNWLTHLSAEKQPEVLKDIRKLVHDRESLIIEGKGNYSSLYAPEAPVYGSRGRTYGLQYTRPDIERACVRTTCGLDKYTIGTTKRACKSHPAEQVTTMPRGSTCGRCSKPYAFPGCRIMPEHGISSAPDYMTKDKLYGPPALSTKRRPFVVIDAEIIHLFTSDSHTSSESTIGWLPVIDGLAGEVLLKHLLLPHDLSRIQRCGLRYSGITWDDILMASRSGTAIPGGLEQLHAEPSKLIDEDTTLAGHALCNDLKNARMGHGVIIDTQLLFAGVEEVDFPSLKVCSKRVLGVEMQMDEKGRHDPLEDACATRELVLKAAAGGVCGDEDTGGWTKERDGVGEGRE